MFVPENHTVRPLSGLTPCLITHALVGESIRDEKRGRLAAQVRRGCAPEAPRRRRTTYFGRTDQPPELRTYNGYDSLIDPPHALEDDLFHLRDPSDPDVTRYLEDEALYARNRLTRLKPLAEKVTGELLEAKRMVDSVTGGNKLWVMRHDSFEYCEAREHPDDNFTSIRRRKGVGEAFVADPRGVVVLNANKVPAMLESEYSPGTYFLGFVRGVNDVRFSDNGMLMAYTVDTSGGKEQCTVMVKDLATNTILETETLYNVDARIEWDALGKSLFFLRMDATGRPHQVWRRWLGSKKEELILQESDERFRLSLDRSLSKQFIFIDSNSYVSNEVFAVPLAENTPLSKRPQAPSKRKSRKGPAVPTRGRQDGIFYSLGHRGDDLIVMVHRPGKPTGLEILSDQLPTVLLAESGGQTFEKFFCLERGIVVSGREGGLSKVWFVSGDSLDEKKAQMVAIGQDPARGSHGVLKAPSSLNTCFSATDVILSYTDQATPKSLFTYALECESRTGAIQHISGLKTDTIFPTASDGTSIPVSLVWKEDLVRKEKSKPLVLAGYGAYGMSLEPHFTTRLLPLLNRGAIFAIAHVRGGGEFGPEWHTEGRLERKETSTSDFISCAEYLVENGYTVREQFVIEGRSAGGLVIGSAINRRPDLFKAAVGVVPFLDLLGTMVDSSLSLTVGEWEEWGNPNERKHFGHMAAISPVHAVQNQSYPDVLLRPAFNDARTGWWESFKFAQAVRHSNTNPLTNIIVDMDMEMGHFDDGSRNNTAKTRASILAYIIDQLGIAGIEPNPGPDQ